LHDSVYVECKRKNERRLLMKKYSYVLRTCSKNIESYNGFKWPKEGYVEAPDWDPTPRCGNGLHGFLNGEGDGSYADWDPAAKWLVVKVKTADIVDLKGKVKFKCGKVIFCGRRDKAIHFLKTKIGNKYNVIGDFISTAVAGYYGIASVGNFGIARAGDRGNASAGVGGVASVGAHGNAKVELVGNASAGNYGTANAGNYGPASAGYAGTTSAGYHGTASVGAYGNASAGVGGVASAGICGTIKIKYYDKIAKKILIKEGYIGHTNVSNLKSCTKYKLNNNNEFEEVK